ncbi:MAG: bZIP transcription factor [Acidilobus sp.]
MSRERQKDDIDDLRRRVDELKSLIENLERLMFALTGEHPIAEAVVKDGALLGVVERFEGGLIFRPAVDVKLSDEAKEYLQGVLDGIRDYQLGYSNSATAEVVLTERSGGWLDAITFNGLRSEVEFKKAKLAAKVTVELSLSVPRGGGHGGH